MDASLEAVDRSGAVSPVEAGRDRTTLDELTEWAATAVGSLYARLIAKLDWDREERERRARKHGRMPAWSCLVTGVADLKKRWRADARGEIWVVPAPDEPRLIVLLPAAGGGRWRVELRATGWKTQEKHSEGGDPAVVKFVTFRDMPDVWSVTVYAGDDHDGFYEYDSFDGYWPSGAIWDLTRL